MIKNEDGSIEYANDFGQDADGKNLPDNHTKNPDCFLYTNSKLMKGAGKAVVCAVGESTVIAQMMGLQDQKVEEQKTELEKKLEKVAE